MNNPIKPRHIPALLTERDEVLQERKEILRHLFPKAQDATINFMARKETRREMMRRMRARRGN